MTTETDKKNPYIRPVDIELVRDKPLPGGAVHIVIDSVVDALRFKEVNEDIFPYSACGVEKEPSGLYLRPNEWVFSNSKQGVIETVFRMKSYGTHAAWCEWSKENPNGYEKFFVDREAIRANLIDRGLWTDELQSQFGLTSRDDKLGWWMLSDLPLDNGVGNWHPKSKVISNPLLTQEKALHLLQATLFDEMRISENADIMVFSEEK